MTQDLHNYLTDRCISDAVQKYSNIVYENNKIVIPIYSKEGKKLFNKYRKDPDNTNPKVPKYMYEKGSSYTVYGYFPGYTPDTKRVYFVEGEFDALVMQSKGVHALSSTGGCSSFKPEWLEPHEEIFVCLDGDEAGMKSSARIALLAQKKMKIFILINGMDITDYFQTGKTMQDFHQLSTVDYEPPAKENKASYKKTIDDLMFQRRTLLQFAQDTTIIDIIVKTLTERYKNLGKKMKKLTPGELDAAYDINKIKAVSITNFIKFGHDNKAHSIYSANDKTPSMHYYPEDNRYYCYSAGKGGDVIDFIQAQQGCSWKEAIAIISKHL